MAVTDVRGWVREHLAKLLGLPPDEITLDQGLDHFGLDSVDAVLMAGELEVSLGIEIDPAAFLQYPTLEAMIVALQAQLKS